MSSSEDQILGFPNISDLKTVISPPGGRVKVEIWVADRVTKMQLKILGVTRSDLTTYRCVARNILGQQEGRISLTGES